MEHKKLKFIDYFVYLFILIIVIFLFYFHYNTNKGTKAIVFIDNKMVKIIPLSTNGIYSFHAKLGRFTVEVINGKIGVIKTNCPEKLCKRMGFINRKGSQIICIPNKVVIKIEGNGEVDDISR